MKTFCTVPQLRMDRHNLAKFCTVEDLRMGTGGRGKYAPPEGKQSGLEDSN